MCEYERKPACFRALAGYSVLFFKGLLESYTY